MPFCLNNARHPCITFFSLFRYNSRIPPPDHVKINLSLSFLCSPFFRGSFSGIPASISHVHKFLPRRSCSHQSRSQVSSQSVGLIKEEIQIGFRYVWIVNDDPKEVHSALLWLRLIANHKISIQRHTFLDLWCHLEKICLPFRVSVFCSGISLRIHFGV